VKVFKFGGASVKDAAAVKNVAAIINQHADDDLWIVISAMGKTTNYLERVLSAYWRDAEGKEAHYKRFMDFHKEIVNELFPFSEELVLKEINVKFKELEKKLLQLDKSDYDKTYDQVVSTGEWLATKIVSAYLDDRGVNNTWLDAREIILTDASHREATVDWENTKGRVKRTWQNELKSRSIMASRRMITQGFIGSDGKATTTLGREGSDFSAGILAWCTDADEVVIWKDVSGMLNADPKYYPDAVKLDSISYREAIELSYFGASVIHPKTIKPLQNKGIPLRVKSFIDHESTGTLISSNSEKDGQVPSYIFKSDQVLISISPEDFSFIMEEGMTRVFTLMRAHKMRANLMQNSALSFSLCVDHKEERVKALTESLSKEYRVLYNEDVSLLTIRHYDEATLAKLLKGREVLVEQRSRQTARFVVRGQFDLAT
jgi:aspartate kinase